MAYRNFTIPEILGLNQDENPESVKPGELAVADNLARRGSFVGTRPGAAPLAPGSDYENAVAEANAIRGAVEFRENFDENRSLIVVADHTTGSKVFYEDAAQLGGTPVINADQDYIYSFAVHANVLYGTGGPPGHAQVQTEDIWTWDGDAAGPSNATVIALTDKGTTARLRPKFVKTWRNFLLMNGFQQTTANRRPSNNPSVTRYATFAADPSLDASWPDSKTVGFNAIRAGLDSYGENYATGFGEYTDNRGDFLILLSNRQLAAVKGDSQFGNDFIVTDTIYPGCVHERAFVNLGLDVGDAVFVSETPGIHSLRQSQEHGQNDGHFLSWKIRPLMNSLNPSRLPFTCGAYAANLGMVVFAMSTSANTTEGHDILMALDVRDPDSLTAKGALWYGPWVLGGGLKVNHLAYMRLEDDTPSLLLFTTTGEVLSLDEDVHADLTTNNYAAITELHPISYGSLLEEKRYGDTMVEVGSDTGGFSISATAKANFGSKSGRAISVDIPGGTGGLVGTAVVGDGTVVGGNFTVAAKKLYTARRGHNLSLRFEHGGLNQAYYIGRIDQQVSGAGEDAGGTG